MTRVISFDHIVFNVRDVEVSAAWYEQVLGMTREDSRSGAGDVRTSMKFGRNKINLRPVSTSPDAWFTASQAVAGASDLCSLTDATPDEVVAHFDRCSVEIVSGPITKSGAQGPICSVYVRDPDGSLIEVSSYQ